MDKNDREFYLNLIEVGSIVAFVESGKMLSAKVAKIEEESYTVLTKNGSVYYPTKNDIVWVKNGSRWPRGIYNALKLNSTINS